MLLRRFAIVLAALAAPIAASADTAKQPAPWMRNVAPDRACIRFGEYDWMHYLRQTDQIRSTGMGHNAGMARDRALGEMLWYLGRGTGRICSCGPKQAVIANLKQMLPELKKRPTIRYQDMLAADHVGGVIAGIEAEGVAVVPPSHEGCKR